ncbi:MAG: hypothetical protein COB42_00835 [Sulfurimonas sp.]|nr:MAG: hypothetical protein COB42_00835 [Sulfurimonas sp.]
MKIVLIFLVTLVSLIAEETYTQGKIDMHGGDNSYNDYTNKNYKGFSNSRIDMSKFLDKNTSKDLNKTVK